MGDVGEVSGVLDEMVIRFFGVAASGGIMEAGG